MSQPWARAGVEPEIRDLLQDPILHKLLACDSLSLRDLETAIVDAQLRLTARRGRSATLRAA